MNRLRTSIAMLIASASAVLAASPGWSATFSNFSTTFDAANSRIRYDFTITPDASDTRFRRVVLGDLSRNSPAPVLLDLTVNGASASPNYVSQQFGTFDRFTFSPALSASSPIDFSYILGNIQGFGSGGRAVTIRALNPGDSSSPPLVSTNSTVQPGTVPETLAEPVPEPLTVLGSLAAIVGMGSAAYKRRLAASEDV